MMKHRYTLLAAVITFGLGVLVEPDISRWSSENGVVAPAEARMGRPMTPNSVAGVARRTNRRRVRRSTVYVNTLPRGCVIVNINSGTYHHCGVTYYQPYQGRYVVVYVD